MWRGRSLLLVAVGVIAVSGVSWLLGTVYTGVISFDSNSQILGRISPRVIDLIAALASGAAGGVLHGARGHFGFAAGRGDFDLAGAAVV